jgi:NitT/TauT family transport system substrate-binding protein
MKQKSQIRARRQCAAAGFAVVLTLMIWTTALTGCEAVPPTAATTSAPKRATVRIAALKGPTGIGLVQLMDNQEKQLTRHDYQVSLFGSSDDIVGLISSRQVDVAALLLAINTLGVLYILEKGDTVRSLADLAGRSIVTSGQGAVPEYVLGDLLAKGGLANPARVEYRAEHAEVMTLAAAGQADLVMLPEPFVTTLLAKNKQFRIALDLTVEWKKVHQTGGSASELSMGCLLVSSSFAAESPDVLKQFLAEYKTSTDFVNAEPAAAGEMVARYGILADPQLAAQAIPNCHIVLIQGRDMQPVLEPFLQILLAVKPASVGGMLPGSSFYWIP